MNLVHLIYQWCHRLFRSTRRCKQFLCVHTVDSVRRHQTYHTTTHTERKIKAQKYRNKTLHQATKYKNKPGSSPALLMHLFSIPVDNTEKQLYWITLLVHLASFPLSGSSQNLQIRDERTEDYKMHSLSTHLPSDKLYFGVFLDQ